MHIPKKGIRAFGIAESYTGRERSVLAGVVMRKDLQIDGFSFGSVTVGGLDATETILRMITEMERRDLNVILLSGCGISWFNVIDPEVIANEVKVPVICVTYAESDGLEEEIRFHFPEDTIRLPAYRKLGERIPADLGTGERIFIRSWGISNSDATRLLGDFTLEGKIPEPLRVARLCARAVSSGRNPG